MVDDDNFEDDGEKPKYQMVRSDTKIESQIESVHIPFLDSFSH